MPSNHLILCHPLLLLLLIFPSIRVFSNESVLHIRSDQIWAGTNKMTRQKQPGRLTHYHKTWDCESNGRTNLLVTHTPLFLTWAYFFNKVFCFVSMSVSLNNSFHKSQWSIMTWWILIAFSFLSRHEVRMEGEKERGEQKGWILKWCDWITSKGSPKMSMQLLLIANSATDNDNNPSLCLAPF